jgi:hypothetical protein
MLRELTLLGEVAVEVFLRAEASQELLGEDVLVGRLGLHVVVQGSNIKIIES